MAMEHSLGSNAQGNPVKKSGLETLEQLLGYRFKNRELLEQALTHSSAVSSDDARTKSYQRLEFLGDRVLGLAISAMLYQAHPDAPEGQLSRALADMVRKETCAIVSEELGVGPLIRMGKGERKTGLARKPAVLGDACESILGAIYCDGGFDAVEPVIQKLWKNRLPVDSIGAADPKTKLQEWAHTKGAPEPTYQEVGRTGPDHAPVFVVHAVVAGMSPAEGQGHSKRHAERAAAEAMLKREGVIA